MAPTQSFEDQLIETCEQSFVPWLQQWIEYDRNPSKQFAIHWITYSDVAKGLYGVLNKIRTALSDGVNLPIPIDLGSNALRANFVVGDDQAWRYRVSKRTEERLWAMLTPEMIELLDLAPCSP